MPRQQAGPPAAARPRQQLRPLRLLTHNVNGLTLAKVEQVVAQWVRLGVDVVCLQETKLQFMATPSMERALRDACQQLDPSHGGFQVLWGLNTRSGRSAGVAILIRKALIHSGALSVTGADSRSNDGRFLMVPISWGGHNFNLVNVYLPCGGELDREQHNFIRTHLAPLAQQPGIWGGDWNWVPVTSRDRVSLRRPRAPPAAAAGPPAAGAADRPAPGGPAAPAAGVADRPALGGPAAAAAAPAGAQGGGGALAADAGEAARDMGEEAAAVAAHAAAAADGIGVRDRRARELREVADIAAGAAAAGAAAAAAGLAAGDAAGALQGWLQAGALGLVAEDIAAAASQRDAEHEREAAARRQQQREGHNAAGHPEVPSTARVFQAAAPDMLDAFRILHPAQRSFTHHSCCSAARLDRWYCSSRFQAFLAHCGARADTPSDHRPVILDLLPAQPSRLGQGYRRARPQQFWDMEAHREDFLGFLREQAEAAPASDTPQEAQALLQWWPGFKQRVLAKCSELARQARADRQQQQPQEDIRTAAAQRLTAAFEAVEGSTSEAEAAAALDGVLRARQQWRDTVHAEGVKASWQRRRDWVHAGERPSKGLTAAINSLAPPVSRLVPGLRSPVTGRTVLGGRALANLVAVYWGNICRAMPTDAAAQRAVLQAVDDSGLRLSAEEATALGGLEVTAEEVAAAVKQSKSGKAPGLDGLPLEIYRKGGALDVLAPLLARLFTAMGQLGQVPAGLLDGVISIIYKKGQRVDPANYRPITLLNTDYRVLAKVLGNRLRFVLPTLIQPAQTGFVPGRLIGENILLHQLLPAALGQESKAGTVFCDFYKAYDTVDRGFLLAVMEHMHVGEGFLKWVKLLLEGTSACACVNGFVSRLVPTTSGVRQGCPLSPFLYLFISQALLCLLTARGFGVQVGGRRLTASAFADDTQPFLHDMFAQAPDFLATMDLFRRAAREGLNLDKTVLLPTGWAARRELWRRHFVPLVQAEEGMGGLLPAAEIDRLALQRAEAQLRQEGASVPPGQVVAGMKVVGEAEALGVCFAANGGVRVDWPARLEKVKGVLTFLSKLPLSMFGRALASSGYGISKLLYAAEFVGSPPDDVLSTLDALQAKLVVRGQAPAAHERRFAGVRAGLLPGHPSLGGFGALPYKQHITARHAMWGVRLLKGDEATPWVYLARRQLAPTGEHVCPAWARLGIAMCSDASHGPHGKPLSPVLRRLAQGMLALPAWRDGAAEPLVPGPWCYSMPLWCNPFVLGTGAPGPLPRRGLEADFGDIAELPTITTVGQARAALQAIRRACQPGDASWGTHVFPTWLCRNGQFSDRQRALERFESLVRAIPACWVRAITGRDLGSAREVVQARLLPRLVWPLPGGNASVPLAKLRVKQATRLQLQPLLEARAVKHGAFIQEAYAGGGAQPAQLDPASLLPLFQQLWELPWENTRKEVFWLLALDGIPTAARLHQGEGEPCNCGQRLPDRVHHFWDCPVARSVCREMQRALGAQAPALSRSQVWLMQAPAGVHSGVWRVACLAALGAMDHGRKLLVAWRLAADAGRRGGRGAPPPLPQRITLATRVAVACFWDLLQDFVFLGLAPAPWLADVSVDHPFLHSVPLLRGGHALRLHRV